MKLSFKSIENAKAYLKREKIKPVRQPVRQVETNLEFEVFGAGQLRISKSNKWECGCVEGFSIGVNWGKHGMNFGGVISNEQAKLLAEHILLKLKK